MGAVGLFRDIRILNDSVVFRGTKEGKERVGQVSLSILAITGGVNDGG